MRRLRPVESAAVKSAVLVRERRAALVRAAIEVFSAKGYHTSTVSDVARAAGMSQGTVYNYVTAKADILYLVCSEVYASFERVVREALAEAGTPLERLRRAVSATVDATFRLQDHLLLLYQELHCLDRKAWRPFLRDAAKLRQIYEEVLTEVEASEGLDFGNRPLAATILLMLPSTLIMRRWDLRDRVCESEAREAVGRFLLRGLGLPDDKASAGRRAEPTRRTRAPRSVGAARP